MPDGEKMTEEVAVPEDAWTTEYNPPQLVGFIACEDVSASVRGDNVYSVQRINYSLQATGWPATFYRVSFAHLWVGGDADVIHEILVRVLDPMGQEVARHGSALVGIPEEVQTDPALIVTFFDALRLEGSGRYRVEMLLDDVLVFKCPLTVLGPPVKKPLEGDEPVPGARVGA